MQAQGDQFTKHRRSNPDQERHCSKRSSPNSILEARFPTLRVRFCLPFRSFTTERFGVPFWQYTLSASSANTEALRLARVATRRDRIVVFQGAYHGHLDDTLVERTGATTVPGLLGTSAQVAQRTRVVPFNRPDALEAALAPGDVAAVITEPALTNVGVVQPAPDFHAYMRAITQQMGTLLILDETHTQMAAWGDSPVNLGWSLTW